MALILVAAWNFEAVWSWELKSWVQTPQGAVYREMSATQKMKYFILHLRGSYTNVVLLCLWKVYLQAFPGKKYKVSCSCELSASYTRVTALDLSTVCLCIGGRVQFPSCLPLANNTRTFIRRAATTQTELLVNLIFMWTDGGNRRKGRKIQKEACWNERYMVLFKLHQQLNSLKYIVYFSVYLST